MLKRMSSKELSEWAAYYEVEPFGQEVERISHAITAVTVANALRGKDTKPYKTSDFIPQFRRGEQGVNEQIQIAEMFTAALGGQDLRED